MEQKRLFPGIDSLRIMSAFAVVYIHGSVSSPSLSVYTDWASFAVPCFFMIAGFLQEKSSQSLHTSRSLFEFIYQKLSRLIPAYMLWSGLYLIFRACKIVYLDKRGIYDAFDIDIISLFFMGGYTYHLWFVPTLMYFSILMFFVCRCVNHLSCPYRILINVSMALISFLIYDHLVLLVPAVPGFENYMTRYFMRNIGFIFLGASTFLIIAQYRSWRKTILAFAVVAWGAVFLMYGYRVNMPTDTVWMVTLSVAIFLSSLVQSKKISPVIGHLAAVTYGIYLSHALFLESIRLFIKVVHIKFANSIVIFMIVVAFAASAFFSIVVGNKTKWRWLVR